jgi:hypothetical protein
MFRSEKFNFNGDGGILRAFPITEREREREREREGEREREREMEWPTFSL